MSGVHKKENVVYGLFATEARRHKVYTKRTIKGFARKLSGIFVLVVLFLGLQEGNAQEADPVRWTFKADKISDQEYDLVFTAAIDKGWFIFSQYLEEGGPWPTSLNFNLAPDYELIALTKESGKKIEGYDALFGVNVIKYAGRMTLSQRITITESLEEINGHIQFMTCNNEGCLPVTNYSFTFSFLE